MFHKVLKDNGMAKGGRLQRGEQKLQQSVLITSSFLPHSIPANTYGPAPLYVKDREAFTLNKTSLVFWAPLSKRSGPGVLSCTKALIPYWLTVDLKLTTHNSWQMVQSTDTAIMTVRQRALLRSVLRGYTLPPVGPHWLPFCHLQTSGRCVFSWRLPTLGNSFRVLSKKKQNVQNENLICFSSLR